MAETLATPEIRSLEHQIRARSEAIRPFEQSRANQDPGTLTDALVQISILRERMSIAQLEHTITVISLSEATRTIGQLIEAFVDLRKRVESIEDDRFGLNLPTEFGSYDDD